VQRLRHAACCEYAEKEIQMSGGTTARAIEWGRDFDAAVKSAGGKLVLLDFSAAPM
jgi:hypothetical protein